MAPFTSRREKPSVMAGPVNTVPPTASTPSTLSRTSAPAFEPAMASHAATSASQQPSAALGQVA